jgi:hypothetical protein
MTVLLWYGTCGVLYDRSHPSTGPGSATLEAVTVLPFLLPAAVFTSKLE